MEFPTLNNSAKLAKRAEKEAARLAKCAENEALLERMARDGIKPYQLPPDEFHTYIQATFDRCRWVPSERGKDRTGDVDEPVEPAPVPAPRRQRKRSLSKVCEAARKAGADRIIVDGVVIVLSPAAAVPESDPAVPQSDTNEWDAMLEVDHGPH
jgi:hypothetical protein